MFWHVKFTKIFIPDFNLFCFVFRYPVSTFSFTLLEQILFDPLFNIADLNSVLYKRARGLDKVRCYRLQLYYMKDFILSCRFATRSVLRFPKNKLPSKKKKLYKMFRVKISEQKYL